MTKRTILTNLTALALGGIVSASPAPVPAANFNQNHPLLTGVLTHYVKDAKVDYSGLKAHPRELNQYLGQVAALPKGDFKAWTEDFEKKSGSVLAGLKPFWSEKSAAALAGGEFQIQSTDYDWSLNDRRGN